MNEEINLLTQRYKGSPEDQEIIRFFRVLSITALFITAFFAVFIFFLKSRPPIDALKKEKNTILASLSILSPKAVKLLLVENRLKDISSIIKKRPNLSETISLVTKEMPKDIFLNSLIINKNKMSLTISSLSLSPINIFLNNLLNLKPNKVFDQIILDSFAIDDKTGNYVLSLNLDLL